jgi:glutamyl-tRNA synthetase
MKAFGKSLGRKGKQLFMPVRLAMTGRLSGPDIPKQLRLLAAAPEQVCRSKRVLHGAQV